MGSFLLQTWVQTASVARSAPYNTVTLVMTSTCLHRREAVPWLSSERSMLEFVFTVWVMALLFSKVINLKLLCFAPDCKSSFDVCFCAFNPGLILLVFMSTRKWESSCFWAEQTGWVMLLDHLSELTGNLEMSLLLLLQMLPLTKACHPVHPANAWGRGA